MTVVITATPERRLTHASRSNVLNNPLRTVGLVTLLITLLLNYPLAMSADQKSPNVRENTPVGEVEKTPKKCTWARLKWSKLCNVDLRGVYKCRRNCANFG